MGKRWEAFKDNLSQFAAKIDSATDSFEKQPVKEKKYEPPARSWKNEILNDLQRHDLEEVVNLPGYEVILDLAENCLEGFITALVQTDPSNKEAVLTAHKLVHAGYLFNKSVQTQVAIYMRMSQAERQEVSELKAALAESIGDPLENQDRLAKVLNPIHQPIPSEPLPRLKRVITTPLDTMLAGPAGPLGSV